MSGRPKHQRTQVHEIDRTTDTIITTCKKLKNSQRRFTMRNIWSQNTTNRRKHTRTLYLYVKRTELATNLKPGKRSMYSSWVDQLRATFRLVSAYGQSQALHIHTRVKSLASKSQKYKLTDKAVVQKVAFTPLLTAMFVHSSAVWHIRICKNSIDILVQKRESLASFFVETRSNRCHKLFKQCSDQKNNTN